MKTRVEIFTLKVNQKGQKNHFQIKIPQNGRDLVGIGVTGLIPYGEMRKYPFNAYAEKLQKSFSEIEFRVIEFFRQRHLLGELKVQSFDDPKNCFYAEVFFEDNGLRVFDYANTDRWAKSYTHNNLRIYHPLDIKNESTILNCFFIERLHETTNQELQFEIKIYLYYKCKQD